MRGQVAFNWSLQKPGTTAPIFAVRTQEQLDDVVGSLAFRLTRAQMQRLDQASKIDMGFPQRWGCDMGTAGCTVERRAGTFLAPDGQGQLPQP